MLKRIFFITITIWLIAFIHVAPYIWFIYKLGPSYKGIMLMGGPDEENYIIQFKEMYDGNFNIGNGVLYEHKINPGTWMGYLPFIISTLMGKAMGLNFHDFIIGMKFIFPAIIAFLFFLLTFLLTRSKLYAIATSFFAVLGTALFTSMPYLYFWIFFKDDKRPHYLPFARPVHPQVVIIPILLYLITFYLALKKKKMHYAVISGILLAFNLYFYLYWTYLYPLTFFSLAVTIFLKNKKLIKQLSITLTTSLLLIIPKLPGLYINLFGKHVEGLGSIAQSSAFTSTPTHTPIITRFQFWEAGALLVVILLFWKKIIKTHTFILLSSMSFTGIFVMNQQIISGIIAQPFHYEQFLLPMLFAVVFMTIIFAIIKASFTGKKLKMTIYGLASIVIIYSVAEGIFIQWRSFNNSWQYYAEYQSMRGVFDWLNKNSEPESVVFAPFMNYDLAGELITIYTHNNVYFNNQARHYPLPEQAEFRKREMRTALIMNMDPNTFAWQIDDHGYLHYPFFGFYFFNWKPSWNRFTYNRLPFLGRKIFFDWVKKYKKMWNSDIAKEVTQYRLDYVLQRKWGRPSFQIHPQLTPYLEKVYEDGQYVLYKLKIQN